ncbi:craniofacial development protein 2-like [Palaemon carinicauda]|uniref:craniofacial development protein 2-like n=1 Tax=Palaemon carinicauda TaxID=392227 RepID=UPI0035B6655D
MNQIGKLQHVESEFREYSLDILALSETYCKRVKKETLDQGNIFIYSGRSDGVGREGVEMMMTPRAEKALTEWRVVNSRLLLAKFKSKQCNMSIIICYAPTNDSLEERKDEHYEEMQRVIDGIPERDIKFLIGDFNAKVGRNNQGIENVVGVESLGKVSNENDVHFISFCSANDLVIGDTTHIIAMLEIHRILSQYSQKDLSFFKNGMFLDEEVLALGHMEKWSDI